MDNVKMKPKYHRYRRSHLALVTSFGASVCAVVIVIRLNHK